MNSFNINIYETKVNIVLENTIEDAVNYIKKFNKKYKREYSLDPFEGCVLEINNKNYTIVLVKPYINDNLISHEAYHVTEFISDNINLSNEGFKEQRAYLNGFINQKIRYILKKIS